MKAGNFNIVGNLNGNDYSRIIYNQALNAHMDEIRIEHSNVFSADPNVGKTDTITVPTSEYVDTAITYNMTLISEAQTAESAPDEGRIVIFEEDVDAITINTDLKAYISRDDGTTWSQVTLANEGEYETDKNILTGTVDISGQPSDTDMVYKITTHNNKDLKIHGVSLLWR